MQLSLSRLPIRLKLILFFSIVLLLISAFMSYYFPKLTKENSLNYIKTQARATASMVASSSGISLATGDQEAIKEAFKLAEDDYRMNFLTVYDIKNEPISTFNPNEMKLNPIQLFTDSDTVVVGDNLFATIPIKYKKHHSWKINIRVHIEGGQLSNPKLPFDNYHDQLRVCRGRHNSFDDFQ